MPAPPAASGSGVNGASSSGSAPSQIRLGDRVRGDRREQDAVAVVTGRQDQAVDSGRADERGVVGRARPQPGADLVEDRLAQLRQHGLRIAQQLVHRAGPRRRCRIRPPRCWRRRPTARRRAGRRRPRCPSPTPRTTCCMRQRGQPQPQRLALDRPHWRTLALPAATPCRTTRRRRAPWSRRRCSRRRQRDADGTPGPRAARTCSCRGDDRDPALHGGLEQRCVQQPRVDLVVVGREQPTGKPAGERRLELAAARRGPKQFARDAQAGQERPAGRAARRGRHRPTPPTTVPHCAVSRSGRR